MAIVDESQRILYLHFIWVQACWAVALEAVVHSQYCLNSLVSDHLRGVPVLSRDLRSSRNALTFLSLLVDEHIYILACSQPVVHERAHALSSNYVASSPKHPATPHGDRHTLELSRVPPGLIMLLLCFGRFRVPGPPSPVPRPPFVTILVDLDQARAIITSSFPNGTSFVEGDHERCGKENVKNNGARIDPCRSPCLASNQSESSLNRSSTKQTGCSHAVVSSR